MTNIKQSLFAAFCALAGITVAHPQYFNNQNRTQNNRAMNREGYPYNTSNNQNYSHQANSSDRSYGYDRDNKPMNEDSDRNNTNRYNQSTRPYMSTRAYENKYTVLPNEETNEQTNVSQFSRYDNSAAQMQQDRQMLQEQGQPLPTTQYQSVRTQPAYPPTQSGMPMRNARY